MSFMYTFLSGSIFMGLLVCALFFIKFWRSTKDFLFITFSFAFALLAFERVGSAYLAPMDESKTWVYIIRLSGFIIILLGIVRKNAATSKS